ncbi:NAD(P)/FAD-dependent oxidoreductase [Blastococcus sp. TF02A-30]|uniref:flavin-containing monooxygenase n=1 Tax=Blastococcus sp. TF02A-30 TaxID=2250580 RepID=UPI000DE88752|nr:NAD(P)/FAD-dependent oxidoreductase [Blastococcus sp. TF02A-30]RBY87878.1 FAD-containing monooxygenase EthA [Blastococcus sp. TF02A-30]
MATEVPSPAPAPGSAALPEHLDVLVVGAGLSGIGAACHLATERPGTTYAVLESRGAIGGTWDLFRYPGIRSDSDMFTLGYSFRPWNEDRAIADGASIRRYIEETAREYGVVDKIRFHTKVLSADWSSADARWTVTVERTDTGATGQLTCSWLHVCSGYYRYDEGFRPHFAGEERFTGELIHPQHWPADFDATGKRIVVIGSGATAVTLVPNLADDAEHVTMLQRTPSYVLSLPGEDPLARKLRSRLPQRWAYPIVRWKSVLGSTALYQFSRRWPSAARKLIRRLTEKQLPAGVDVDTHFNPPYDPWDQRLCLVPDGDLFRSLRRGRASIVTDRIASFTERGIALESGQQLDADVIVTATGLNLLPVGGMTLSVDGGEVKLADTVSYKGMMVSGVPNFTMVIGYTNASWTLKADLVNRYLCRLLAHLEARGLAVATAVAPPEGADQPFLDLAAGYVQRSLADLPKQGRRTPWRLHQNYIRDVRLMRHGSVEDEGIRFSAAPARTEQAAA